MKHNISLLFFAILVTSTSWSATYTIVNNSDFPLVCLYGDTHYVLRTVKHNHPRTAQKANKTMVMPGERKDIELSDDKTSTIYAYRLSTDTLQKAITELKDTIIVDGLPDFSKLDVNELITMARDVSFHRLLDIAFNDNASLRYLDVTPPVADEKKLIVVKNKTGFPTIAPLELMNEVGLAAQAVPKDPTGDAAKMTITIANESEFPVFVAYGPKTWGERKRDRIMLNVKYDWLKDSSKGVVFEDQSATIDVDPNQNLQLLFYRISPSLMIGNITKAGGKVVGGIAQKAALTAVSPGSTLVADIMKLYTIYATVQKLREEAPFAPLAVMKEKLDSCKKIVVKTNPNKVTIDAACVASDDSAGEQKDDTTQKVPEGETKGAAGETVGR